jgi:DNA-binding protein YbaB
VTDSQHPDAADPFAGFTAELTELRAKAEEVQERIKAATATVSSPDGAATVTVGPGGALMNLVFGERAYRRPPPALAALVLSLIGKAQRQVSAQVSGAFAEMVGENSSAMDVLNEFLPADADAEDPTPNVPVEQSSSPPPAQPLPPSPPPDPRRPPPVSHPRPSRPPAPSRRAADEDDDFSDPW